METYRDYGIYCSTNPIIHNLSHSGDREKSKMSKKQLICGYSYFSGDKDIISARQK